MAGRPDSFTSMGGRRVEVTAETWRFGLYDSVSSRAREMPRADVTVGEVSPDAPDVPRWQPVAALAIVGGAICVPGCNSDQTYFLNNGLRSFAWYLGTIESPTVPPFAAGAMDWMVKKALFGIEVPLVQGAFNFATPDASHLGLIIAGEGLILCNEVQLWVRLWPGDGAPFGSGVRIATSLIVDRLGDSTALEWDPLVTSTASVQRLIGKQV